MFIGREGSLGAEPYADTGHRAMADCFDLELDEVSFS
jgi:4-hydroxy-tetrahydrodipicolinate reductase